ncbi:tyrosine phosphatase family-domain-containing protein [Lipomyces oligophaga]|uniref:tyrosine phosphatase family-domain-containing protein n=1 Tax=Lipomyces oligophaga TaxID=45792 RepID=UPI0034CE2134
MEITFLQHRASSLDRTRVSSSSVETIQACSRDLSPPIYATVSATTPAATTSSAGEKPDSNKLITGNHPALVTPLRYGIVYPKVHRGLYPRKVNLPFLRRLKLKTIISLTPEPLIDEVRSFCEQEGINMIHIKTSKSKKKDVAITYTEVTKAIEILISQQSAPVYFHCLNGSQTTSLVVACLRKLSFWRTSSIFSEFSYYSEVSAADHKFVEEFKAEIELPVDTVPWIWMGLSRKGVVDSHPYIKIKNNIVPEEQDLNYIPEHRALALSGAI